MGATAASRSSVGRRRGAAAGGPAWRCPPESFKSSPPSTIGVALVFFLCVETTSAFSPIPQPENSSELQEAPNPVPTQCHPGAYEYIERMHIRWLHPQCRQLMHIYMTAAPL